MESIIKLSLMLFIEVLKNILSEVFYLSNDIPPLVIFNIFIDIIANPSQDLFAFLKTINQLIDSLSFHLFIIEINTEISRKIQFTSKITQYRLKEGVNRLYTKLIIMMGKQRQSFSGILPNREFRETSLL